MSLAHIVIRGARQHNLKNIDVNLPRNKLTVITGLSGSGKSTLAFDTLYAEGRRRYVESLSTYARQFLGRMEKPEVDFIEGLSPAISIEQKTAAHNPRSTVGTVTEIYDYLRLLFARVGTPHCCQCNKPLTALSLDQMIDEVFTLPVGAKIFILAPVQKRKQGHLSELLKRLKKDGFSRIRLNDVIMEIDDVGKLKTSKAYSVDVVVDRLMIKENLKKRLADSLELALAIGGGTVIVARFDGGEMQFNEQAKCNTCDVSYPEFTPASFSFNSPHGACTACDGLGVNISFDPDRIVPNPDLSLREGAVTLWAHRNSVQFMEFLEALTKHYGTDIYTPYKDLPAAFKQVLMQGSGEEEITFYFERGPKKIAYQKKYEGIIPNLMQKMKSSGKKRIRIELEPYMNHLDCEVCSGTRLKTASRFVKLDGSCIADFTALPVNQLLRRIEGLTLGGKRQVIAAKILKEICERLRFLSHVGLDYLSLDRSAATLSGGESQRIRLATQIGSKLTGVLYVLDEPSIGLHQKDNQKLLAALLQMRDAGNTVLVVEHDEETILAADYVVDMGPKAGIHGGEVVFSGPPERLLADEKSLTGQYLSGRKEIPVPPQRRKGEGACIEIKGATSNNLKAIDVTIPLGCFICVTGVSGSGKSTLVFNTLYRALVQAFKIRSIGAGKYRSVSGLEHLDKVVHIDQSPIGKTPRSNPGTYLGLFTFVRELFAKTPEARARGYLPSRFSFNAKGGRCEACKGDGILKIEMHFLPDVYVPCDICKAKRFNRETLEIKYKGQTIADVLNLTINQALAFFTNVVKIREKLEILADVGLGYLRLGQAATTFSGGEAQRIKLARELSRKGTGRTIYVLDEPTTGLHVDDIYRLLKVFDRLVDAGNTVLVIEHHMDVIKSADYLIDLGPEGGEAGGYVIGSGTPEDLAQNPDSHTGQYLARVLARKVSNTGTQ